MSGAAQNVDGSTMVELLSSFQTEITDAVLRLEDAGAFQNRSELAPNLREFLEAIIGRRLPDKEWPTALYKLTNVLGLLHERRVIVLIDEYDSPISYAAQHPYFTEVCPSPSLIKSTSYSLRRQIYFSATSSRRF